MPNTMYVHVFPRGFSLAVGAARRIKTGQLCVNFASVSIIDFVKAYDPMDLVFILYIFLD